MKDLENTKNQVKKIKQETKENKENLDVLVTIESEPEEEDMKKPKIDMKSFNIPETTNNEQLEVKLVNIINSFKGKYKFRTVDGIAKEIKSSQKTVNGMLEELQYQGATKCFIRKDGKELWALTQKGQLMAEK